MKQEKIVFQEDGWYFADETWNYVGPYKTREEAIRQMKNYAAVLDGSLDECHYHELIDRLYFVNSMIDEMVVEHPVAQVHRDIQAKIKAAQEYLYEAYNMAAQIRFQKTEE